MDFSTGTVDRRLKTLIAQKKLPHNKIKKQFFIKQRPGKWCYFCHPGKGIDLICMMPDNSPVQ